MKAMVLDKICRLDENRKPLKIRDVPIPEPGKKEVLVRVGACGVCHTELDEIEGRTPPCSFPMILGHEIVGTVEKLGTDVKRFAVGDRVGIAWIYRSCQKCAACLSGKENLCPDFLATGRDAPGGYAEYTTVHEDFAFDIPSVFSDAQAAPFLCAGAIGYRSLCLTGIQNGDTLGLTGFGASAHLVLKMVLHSLPDTQVFVFARNPKERAFALDLGAVWAGKTEEICPGKLQAIIDTTPAWNPVVKALQNLAPGGRIVINAIRKENRDKESLLEIDYPRDLWMEKEIKSVANVTRKDVAEFLQLAAKIPILPQVRTFALQDANQALCELKDGGKTGAKVLLM